MQKIRFEEAVRAIRARDRRFDADAYAFLRDSLDYTVEQLRSEESIEHRHVSGEELLEGLRDFALKEFGPMAATVLESWGLHSCEDIGEMVFQLIESGAFGKSEEDSPEDFKDVFDFDEAFREPFRPKVQRSDTPEASSPADRARNLTAGSRRRSSDAADSLEAGSESSQPGSDGLS